jgi:tetratricopeptide (TPR) repeat protein
MLNVLLSLESIRQLQREQRLHEALLACSELFQNCPEPEVEVLLALLHCQMGQLEQGREHLNHVLNAQDHLDAPALTDMAGIYILLQEPRSALELLEKALSLEPDFPPARVRQGLVALQTGRWQAAIDDLSFGLKSLSLIQHGPIHINMARAFLALGQAESALRQVQAAKEITPIPEWPLSLVEIEVYLALNRWNDAEIVVRDTLQRGIEEKRCLHLFALVLAAQDRHDEAEYYLRKGLEQHPDDVDLLLRLSELAEVRGRFGEALHGLRRAVDLEPENADHWARLSQWGKRHFDSELAGRSAEKALELTSEKIGIERAQALAAMAEVEKDGERAERYYREALEQFANYLPARLGLGHLLLQWGRIEEAVAEFEAVAKYYPVAGYGALITARRFPDDPEILKKIEKAAYLPSLEGPMRSSLLFDLAAAWEHRKDDAKAFHFAIEANAASRKFLPFRAEIHRAFCNRIMQAFSAEFFATRTDFGHPSSIPVFVLGMPRSGTTLVEQIISGHPEIYGAGEIGCVSPIIQSLSFWERRSGSGRDYPECVDDLTASQTLQYAERILGQIREYAPKARYIVDKLPHNFENIGLIRLLFPNAPIIHVLRDPRDVAISNFFTNYQAKFGGMGFAYDLGDIGRHLVDYRRLMTHWDQVLHKPILTVRYEEVVDDVETAARQLLDYIGVDWHPEVLDFQHLERAVKTASVWQVRQPIYQTSKAKWRRYADYLGPLEETLAEEVPPVEPSSTSSPLPPGLFFQGIEHLEAGRGKLAEQVFRRILERFPKHAAATHFLGMAFYQQRRYLKALKWVRLSIELHPGHADWHRHLGLVLIALQLPEEAALALEKSRGLQRGALLERIMLR